MSRASHCVAALFVASGCSSISPPLGAAFLRVTEIPAACQATMATGPTGIDQFVNLPYDRAHTAAAFEGGSHFGGDLVALGWQMGDGRIARLQVDVGPNRGYGISAFPAANPGPTAAAVGSEPAFSQALSYVEWKGTTRTFAAQKVWGIVNYVEDKSASPDGSTWPPLTLYAHVALDGIGAMGEAQCRVLGVHVAADHQRTDSYDPAWLAPSPSALVVDGAPVPDFASDAPLTTKLVMPGTVSDPGGDPPKLGRHALALPPGVSGGGGGDSGDDGSGDCD